METAAKEILKIDKTNWTPVKFGDVVFEPKENAKDIYNEGIEHVVGLEHIDSENIHLTRAGVLEETTTFSKKFRVGDVLFGRRRAYLKKAALATFDGICSGDITVFRAKKNLLPELLPFIVNNEKFFDYAVKHSAGGLSPRVKFKDLANYEFLLPPKDQQTKLAELLWAMDEVIEREKKVIFKIEMHGLVWKEQLLNGVNRSGWNFIELDQVCDVIDPHPSHRAPKSVSDGFPFIGIGDVNEDGTINIDNARSISEADVDKQRQTFLQEKNDIGFGRVATIGKVVWLKEQNFKYAVSPTMSIIKPKKQNPIFIFELLKSNYFKNQVEKLVTGSTRRSVGIQKLRKARIWIPSRLNQDSISEELSKWNEVFIQSKEKKFSSKSLQKSLINQIF